MQVKNYGMTCQTIKKYVLQTPIQLDDNGNVVGGDQRNHAADLIVKGDPGAQLSQMAKEFAIQHPARGDVPAMTFSEALKCVLQSEIGKSLLSQYEVATTIEGVRRLRQDRAARAYTATPGSASADADRAARKLMAANPGTNYIDALHRAFAEQPELKRRYGAEAQRR